MEDQNNTISNDNICAVVVTYQPDTKLPIRIKETKRQVKKIVIVDNGSSDDCVRMLRDICIQEEVFLLANSKNVGIARALNQGIEYLSRLGYEWALTLDQDSIPADSMVNEQIAVYNGYSDKGHIGIIAANPTDGFTGRRPYATECADRPWIEQVVVITSGSLMSLKAYETIGPFREDFFIDAVDQEYCLRLRANGYKVLVSSNAGLIHNLGAPRTHKFIWRQVTPTNHSYIRRYYMARNRIILAKKYYIKEPGWITHQLSTLIKSTIMIIFYEHDKYRKLRNTAIGIWHGLIGRSGQYFTEDPSSAYIDKQIGAA